MDKKKFFPRIKRWLFEDAFGTIDSLRVELLTRYECKRLSLSPERGVTIDWYILNSFANFSMYVSSGNEDSIDKIPENLDTNREEGYSAMLICCPNAGYYESIYYNVFS